VRLGVNARRLSGQRLGVARYIEYMLKHWNGMVMPSDSVTLYVREPLGDGAPERSDVFTIKVLQPRLTGLLWESLLLSRHAQGLDVLFSPSYSLPLTYRGRSVLAIHSLNEAQSGTHPWWYHVTYRQIYRLSAQKAHRVIVPSQSTKEDMQEHYRIPGEKIEVIPLGVDGSFHPVEDVDLLRSTRHRYLGADRPYILFVGKLSQRRNIPTLLAAFSALKKREGIPHSLLLVGPNHLDLPVQQLGTELGIGDSLIQIDGRFADHRELVSVYNAADLFINPSSYEGFSLPLVEAMACGVPVVTVNRAALREIADGCALTVEEPTVETLADAMHRALNDRDLRQELRARGLRRARDFRWEDTARRTLDILRLVAQH
jgi:glycosyltransferase involved in cell wall biosynthesis